MLLFKSFASVKSKQLAKCTRKFSISKNNVAYNLFEKWYRDMRKKIVEVKGKGSPRSCSLGNRDYQKLMPATIGINTNKSCAIEHRTKPTIGMP